MVMVDVIISQFWDKGIVILAGKILFSPFLKRFSGNLYSQYIANKVLIIRSILRINRTFDDTIQQIWI